MLSATETGCKQTTSEVHKVTSKVATTGYEYLRATHSVGGVEREREDGKDDLLQ